MLIEKRDNLNFYMYILISRNKKRTYTGCTTNILTRLEEHNQGKVKSSRPYLPYDLLYCEEFANLKMARKKEAFFKSTTGRREIRQIIESRNTQV